MLIRTYNVVLVITVCKFAFVADFETQNCQTYIKLDMENETLKFTETGNNANLLLSAGLPSAIWHKKWSERFDMLEDGTKVGYANNSGWFFYADGKDEFIEQYSKFHNRGVIKPCR